MVGIAAGAVTLAGSPRPTVVFGPGLRGGDRHRRHSGRRCGRCRGVWVCPRRGRGRPGPCARRRRGGLAVNVLVRADLDAAFGVTSLVASPRARSCCSPESALLAGRRRTVYVVAAAGSSSPSVSSVAFGLAASCRHDLGRRRSLAEEAVASSSTAITRPPSEFEPPPPPSNGPTPSCRRRGRAAPASSHSGPTPRRRRRPQCRGASGSAITADALDDIDPEALHVERARRSRGRLRPRRAARSRRDGPHGTPRHRRAVDSPWLIDPASTRSPTSGRASPPTCRSWRTPSMRSSWRRDCSAPTSRSATSSCSPVRRGARVGGAVFDHVELLAEDGQLSIADVGGELVTRRSPTWR